MSPTFKTRTARPMRAPRDIPEDNRRDGAVRRDDASRLVEERLREAVRYYEDDLRELAKT